MTAILSRVWCSFRKRALPIDEGSAGRDVPSKRAKLDDGLEARARGDVRAGGVKGEEDDQQSEVEGKGEAEPCAESGEDGARELALLECPVCVDTMMSPVRQCVNGHCVCNSCRERVSACPICRGVLSAVTHHELDDLAKNLNLPCVFRQQGCLLRFKISERDSHHLSCQYNIRGCPLELCSWTGPFCNLQSHALADHPQRTFRVTFDKPIAIGLPVKDGDVRRALVVEDVVFLMENEIFVVEMNVDALPGSLAIVVRQLTACRSRLTPIYCAVTMSGEATGDVVSFRNRVTLEDEDLVNLADNKRCFLVDMWVAEKIGQQGLNMEYTLSRNEHANSGSNVLKWIAGRFWR